jgi:hypothetical protein
MRFDGWRFYLFFVFCLFTSVVAFVCLLPSSLSLTLQQKGTPQIDGTMALEGAKVSHLPGAYSVTIENSIGKSLGLKALTVRRFGSIQFWFWFLVFLDLFFVLVSVESFAMFLTIRFKKLTNGRTPSRLQPR